MWQTTNDENPVLDRPADVETMERLGKEGVYAFCLIVLALLVWS